MTTLLNVVYVHLAEGRTDEDLKRFNAELEADPARPASRNVESLMRMMGGRIPAGMRPPGGGG